MRGLRRAVRDQVSPRQVHKLSGRQLCRKDNDTARFLSSQFLSGRSRSNLSLMVCDLFPSRKQTHSAVIQITTMVQADKPGSFQTVSSNIVPVNKLAHQSGSNHGGRDNRGWSKASPEKCLTITADHPEKLPTTQTCHCDPRNSLLAKIHCHALQMHAHSVQKERNSVGKCADSLSELSIAPAAWPPTLAARSQTPEVCGKARLTSNK